jgi:carbamoyl-phosphate synthase small subunit
MKFIEERQAVLLLEDGMVFHGKAAGKIGTVSGEVCFNTGMTGYQELFTDPSYFGQIMVTTNVHIGNYGISNKENQSGDIKIAGLVCKVFNDQYSRKMANESVQDFFIQHNLTAISDVDTRGLVNYIRHKGSMNAVISSEELDIDNLKEYLVSIPSMEGLELSSKVTTKQPYFYGNPEASKKIAVLDLGIKTNILENFVKRDCYMQVFPGDTSIENINAWNPDGFFISNGPGDPSAMPYAIKTAREMIEIEKPLFGICLGHQVFAEALGISTYKMHNGHRGLNHPVKNLVTGRSEITSQNHGFCVNTEEVKAHKDVEVTHVNLNDGTVEGMRHKNGRAFTVQYHPEASPGPHDAEYLFDDFIRML